MIEPFVRTNGSHKKNPSHKGCWALTDSNLMATGAPVEMLIPGTVKVMREKMGETNQQLITWQTTIIPYEDKMNQDNSHDDMLIS